MSKEAKIKWHGPRPVDNGELEEAVRTDMREGGVDMKRPHNLVFSTVILTDSFDGPSVHVWGKKGGRKFHARYSPKTEWVAHPANDEGGAA